MRVLIAMLMIFFLVSALLLGSVKAEMEGHNRCKSYDHECNHQHSIEGDYEPTFVRKGDIIKIQTDIFVALIDIALPSITYYYASDNGTTGKFTVHYSKIIAFNDDGDGYFESREREYMAMLSNVDWKLSNIVYSENTIFGSYIEFSLHGTVDVMRVHSHESIENWAEIEFCFLIASRSANVSTPYPYTINGGAELKIDVKFAPLKPLGVNRVAVEHLFYDATQNHELETHESDGHHRYRCEMGMDTEKRFEDMPNVTEQKFSFIKPDGEEHGYYSWPPFALVSYEDNSDETIEVKASYKTDGTYFRLYLSYLLNDSIVEIVHDPSVGINAEHIPSPYTASIVNNFFENVIAYSIGSIIAILIIIASTAYLRWKREKEFVNNK